MQHSETFNLFSLALQRHFFFNCTLIFCAAILSSCFFGRKVGKLTVRASTDGQYDIYRIATENPLQLISEQRGQFNTPVDLEPGRYLVLADCSSELVVINPQSERFLIADLIDFKAPPVDSLSPNSFNIQCTRHEKTQSRQKFVNKFALNVLRGSWEILVGMTPLKLELKQAENTDAPIVKSINLSAVRVEGFEKSSVTSRYFVSLQNSMVSLTESQDLGSWLFLLRGAYTLELNGSLLSLKVDDHNVISVKPGFVRVTTPPSTPLDLAPSIQGNPLFVEINGSHWLNLNEVYPVLPGEIRLRLVGSEKEHMIQIKEGENQDLTARAVVADLNCPPWDWTCLGSRKIFLYEKDAHYPFAEGLSDVPLLFFEKDVWLVIEGSRELRAAIPPQKELSDIKTGRVIVTPSQEMRQGIVTDLVRIEAHGSDFAGNTFDLSLDQPSMLYLTPGVYQLAHYVSSVSADGDRRKITRRIEVKANSQEEIPITVFLSEKKFKQLAKKNEQKTDEKQMARRRLITQKYRSPAPIRAM